MSEQDPFAAQDAPITAHRGWKEPSVFQPDSLLREAYRQKGLGAASVPDVCILDHDSDLARRVRTARLALPDPGWACYHTQLLAWGEGDMRMGSSRLPWERHSPCWSRSSCSPPAAASSST